MIVLFATDPRLFLPWLQVPKEPIVPTLSGSQSWKCLIPGLTSLPLLTFLDLVFSWCLLCWSQLSRKKHPQRWHCFLWATLFYFLNITQKKVFKSPSFPRGKKPLYFTLLQSIMSSAEECPAPNCPALLFSLRFWPVNLQRRLCLRLENNHIHKSSSLPAWIGSRSPMFPI